MATSPLCRRMWWLMSKTARRKSAQLPLLTAEDLKPFVEAALFATAQPIGLDELADMLGEGKRKVKIAIDRLIEDYISRPHTALEIDESDAGYILAVKTTYGKVVERLVPMELTQGALRTLSLIAVKQPIVQTALIELRGSTAYEHIKELLEHGLIVKESQGRSFLLKTAPKFAEYFKVDKETIERHLLALKPDLGEPEA